MAGSKSKPTEKLKSTNRATSSKAAELLGGNNQSVNAFKANAALAFSQFGQFSHNSQYDRHDNEDKSQSNEDVEAFNNTTKISSLGREFRKNSSSTQIPGLPSSSPIDDQLANLFKRMGKKDAITRIKTLQEILKYTDSIINIGNTASVNNETSSVQVSGVVNGLLMGWPSIFKAQAFDIDRRIRALSINIMSNFMKITKKKSAPYLGELVGPWICSFFDTSTDISKLSISVFDENFNKTKGQKNRVLEFCYSGVLEYLMENLLYLTEAAVGDKKLMDDEELKIRYQFMISGSFHSLEYLLNISDLKTTVDARFKYEKILGNEGLWKKFLNVAENSISVTKAAYSCFSAWMKKQQSSDFNIENSMNIAQLVIKQVFQTKPDANLNTHIWDSVLLSTKNYPELWLMKNNKGNTVLYNSFIQYLESGFMNLSAEYSYNSMLVLLNLIPANFLLEENRTFQILESLWLGAPQEIKRMLVLDSVDSVSKSGSIPSSTQGNKKQVGIVNQSGKIKLFQNSSKTLELFLNAISECSFFCWKIQINSISHILSDTSDNMVELFNSVSPTAKKIVKICIELGTEYNVNDLLIKKNSIKNLIVNSLNRSNFIDPEISDRLLQSVLDSVSKTINSVLSVEKSARSAINFLSLISNICDLYSFDIDSDKNPDSQLLFVQEWATQLASSIVTSLVSDIQAMGLDRLNLTSINALQAPENSTLLSSLVLYFPALVFGKHAHDFAQIYNLQTKALNSGTVSTTEFEIDDFISFNVEMAKYELSMTARPRLVSQVLDRIFESILKEKTSSGSCYDYLCESGEWWRLKALISVIAKMVKTHEWKLSLEKVLNDQPHESQCLNKLSMDLLDNKKGSTPLNLSTISTDLVSEFFGLLLALYFETSESPEVKFSFLGAQTVEVATEKVVSLAAWESGLNASTLEYSFDSLIYRGLLKSCNNVLGLLGSKTSLALNFISALHSKSTSFGVSLWFILYSAMHKIPSSKKDISLSNDSKSLVSSIERTLIERSVDSFHLQEILAQAYTSEISLHSINLLTDSFRPSPELQSDLSVDQLINIGRDLLAFINSLSLNSRELGYECRLLVWSNWFLISKATTSWDLIFNILNTNIESTNLFTVESLNQEGNDKYDFGIKSLPILSRKNHNLAKKMEKLKIQLARFATFNSEMLDFAAKNLSATSTPAVGFAVSEHFKEVFGSGTLGLDRAICGFTAIDMLLSAGDNSSKGLSQSFQLASIGCSRLVSSLVDAEIQLHFSQTESTWVETFIGSILQVRNHSANSTEFLVSFCRRMGGSSLSSSSEACLFWSAVLVNIFGHYSNSMFGTHCVASDAPAKFRVNLNDTDDTETLIDFILCPFSEFLSSTHSIDSNQFELLFMAKLLSKYRIIERVKSSYIQLGTMQYMVLKKLEKAAKLGSIEGVIIYSILLKITLESESTPVSNEKLAEKACQISLGVISGVLQLDSASQAGFEITAKKQELELSNFAASSSLLSKVIPALSYRFLLLALNPMFKVLSKWSTLAISESNQDFKLLLVASGSKLVEGFCNTYLAYEEIELVSSQIEEFDNQLREEIFLLAKSGKYNRLQFAFNEYSNAIISSLRFSSVIWDSKVAEKLEQLCLAKERSSVMVKGYFYYIRKLANLTKLDGPGSSNAQQLTQILFKIDDISQLQTVAYTQIFDYCRSVKKRAAEIFRHIETFKDDIDSSVPNPSFDSTTEMVVEGIRVGGDFEGDLLKLVTHWVISVWLLFESVGCFASHTETMGEINGMDNVVALFGETRVFDSIITPIGVLLSLGGGSGVTDIYSVLDFKVSGLFESASSGEPRIPIQIQNRNYSLLAAQLMFICLAKFPSYLRGYFSGNSETFVQMAESCLEEELPEYKGIKLEYFVASAGIPWLVQFINKQLSLPLAAMELLYVDPDTFSHIISSNRLIYDSKYVEDCEDRLVESVLPNGLHDILSESGTAVKNQVAAEIKTKVTGCLVNAVKEGGDQYLESLNSEASSGSNSNSSSSLMVKNKEVARIDFDFEAFEYRLGLSVTVSSSYPLQEGDMKQFPLKLSIEQGKNIVISQDKSRVLEVLFRSLSNQHTLVANRLDSMLATIIKSITDVLSEINEKDTCNICYSTFSADNNKLPNKTCSTCKQKYHSTCLFKWFKSSNQVTCPYCKNIF